MSRTNIISPHPRFARPLPQGEVMKASFHLEKENLLLSLGRGRVRSCELWVRGDNDNWCCENLGLYS